MLKKQTEFEVVVESSESAKQSDSSVCTTNVYKTNVCTKSVSDSNYPAVTETEEGISYSKAEIKNLIIKYGLSFLLMIAISWLTFHILLKQYSWTEIRQSLSRTNIPIFLLSSTLIWLHEFCLAYNLKTLLDLFTGQKVPYAVSLQTVIVGFYFNNITPSAAGGQPMEIYYLYRRGVHVAHSSLVFIVMSLYFYISMFIYTGIAIIFNRSFVLGNLGHMRYFLVIGLVVNFLIAVCTYLIVYRPSLLRSLLKGILNILIKLRVLRQPHRHFRGIARFFRNYAGGSDLIRGNWRLALRLLAVCLVQVGSLFAIPFGVCLSLGAKFNWRFFFETFNLQSILYISTSAMPTPGAVGITESGFITMFESVLPHEQVLPAMILTRVINLYGFLIIAALVVLWSFTVLIKRPLKR